MALICAWVAPSAALRLALEVLKLPIFMMSLPEAMAREPTITPMTAVKISARIRLLPIRRGHCYVEIAQTRR